jgi:hypothetical protein
MGQYNSKHDQEYNNLVDILDELSFGWKSHNECQLFLKKNSSLINLKAYKLVKEYPDVIIKLIKVHPETKLYLLDILGKDNIKNISLQLDEYNL